MKNIELDQNDKYCIFKWGGDTFGISAVSVRNVSPCPPVSAVPLIPSSTYGMSYVQREFVPVFQMSEKTAAAPDNNAKAIQQMLMVEGKRSVWGLLIDNVVALSPLEVALGNTRDVATGWGVAAIGTATFHDLVVLVLDAESLFEYLTDRVECQLRQSWGLTNREAVALDV